MKLSTWLTQLINMFYNNLKIMMVINLEMPQKKDYNSIKPNKKRKSQKSKKLLMKDFANYANKF